MTGRLQFMKGASGTGAGPGVTVLALCATLAGCGSEPSAPPSVSAAPTAASAPAVPFHEAVGVLVADQVADIAPRFAGILLRVRVRAGDPVVAGQVVAELDPRPYEEEVRVAEASLGAAEASRRQAMVDIDDARRRLVMETKAVSAGVSATATIEEARLAVKRVEAAAQRAVASVAAENARLTTARSRVAESRLLAPFSGQVAIRYVDAGAMLSAGHAVVRVVGGAGSRLRFAVEPDQAAGLAPGVELSARVDTVAAPIRAVVRQVSPALDPASGMLFVEAELRASAGVGAVLRPGLAAMVRVP